MFRDELFYYRKYLKNMFKKNMIRFNQFSIIFFILFVKKFEKKLYFCVNYRKFNAMIVKNQYSISFIQKILIRLC